MAINVVVDNLSFGYGKLPLLQDLSLSLKAGEIVTLIGLSGSGKTTLLKLISGLLSVSNDTITLCNDYHPKARQHVAYMMQQDLLLPWRTVLENVTLAAEMGHSNRNVQTEALHILGLVGMSDCAHLYPEELSGGMHQRVSLARTLLQKRPILLLDEPFAALDVLLREQLYLLLRQIRDRYGLTILLVTHDFRDALVLSDRILMLAKGKIDQEWSIPADQRDDRSWYLRLREALLLSQSSFSHECQKYSDHHNVSSCPSA